MREIKFRAWIESTKNMMYLDFKNKNIHQSRMNVALFSDYIREEGWAVLMQYTGLKDKNGKEIYEGDVVKIDAGYSGDHFYRESLGIITWDEDRWYPNNPKEKDGITWQDFNYRMDVEIIGNVYESPELCQP